MLELLSIKFAPYTEEVFYPWEQHPEVNNLLRVHMCACHLCSTTTTAIFGTSGQQTKMTIGCVEGRALAERLLAEKANYKSWKT